MRADAIAGRHRFSLLCLIALPKPNGERRWVGIPTVRDRIVGRVLAVWLTGRTDRRLHRSSFAYRPGRGVLDAVRRIRPGPGRAFVARFDIDACFDSLPPMACVEALGPIEPWAAAMVEQAIQAPYGRGAGFRRDGGIPQGSPLSPLLCNCYLDRLDRELAGACAEYVRYADDMAACCATRREAYGPPFCRHRARAIPPAGIR